MKPNAKFKKTKKQFQKQASKQENEKEEVQNLILKSSETIQVDLFNLLPISTKTMKGLEKFNFSELTPIQKASIPLALAGNDILGAAKTGSGKTIAFLIPCLEILYKNMWSADDGLGALIISPTRELAMQIFDVLKKIGKEHSFSAGLLIGGKDLKSEQDRIGRMNILVATPGRLLQHLDESTLLDVSNLKMLILDEADRILDSGFEKAINAIIEHLPTSRQTLLFSATQTKSVKDLARLSLVDPKYVAVDSAPPKNLVQSYSIVELHQKLDILFSFLKTHQKLKIMVFLSSCKQVRLVFESFCRMQPGIVLMCLHGKQKQAKRMAIFDEFCRKRSVCLFATDIAARGLDFPMVDWVIQLDCPEDVDTYIHRVGRTARYESSGKALLFLLPSEEQGMNIELEKKGIVVKKVKINNEKLSETKVSKSLAAYCSQDPELKYLAQKSFISYIRSIHLQKNKAIFNLDEINLDLFAESLGLPGTPKIKFAKKAIKQNGPESDSEKQVKSKIDKLFTKTNTSVLSDHYKKMINNETSNELLKVVDDEDDIFNIKRVDHGLDDTNEPIRILNKRQLQKQKEKELKKIASNSKRIEFDDEGNPIKYELESLGEYEKRFGDLSKIQQEHVALHSELMNVADIKDKLTQKNLLRERKRERRNREKEIRRIESGGDVGVSLGHGNDENSGDDEIESHISIRDDSADESNQDNELDMNEDDDTVPSELLSPENLKRSIPSSQLKTLKKRRIDNGNLQTLEEIAMSLIN